MTSAQPDPPSLLPPTTDDLRAVFTGLFHEAASNGLQCRNESVSPKLRTGESPPGGLNAPLEMVLHIYKVNFFVFLCLLFFYEKYMTIFTYN